MTRSPLRAATAEVRVIDGRTIQPFLAGPLAEPKTVAIRRDPQNKRIYAHPRPVWFATETAAVWGFEVGGVPVSLPTMRTLLPGQSVEFCGVELNY